MLVIAFDGLDSELVEEFELENLKQEYVGTIDNNSSVSCRKTSELFASFITGKTHTEHGVKGLKTWNNSRKGLFIDLLTKNYSGNIRGFDRLRKTLKSALAADERYYQREDLQSETLFEKIENSRAMFVPSYNPSPFFRMNGIHGPLRHGYSPSKTLEIWNTREHHYRKRTLMQELESDITPIRDFLMCHFHRPDADQHMYPIKNEENKSKLMKSYRELDKLAGEIKEKALEKGYENILFMSDHGLPTDKAHNKNAFYSCNAEIFPEKEPHITDFYEVICGY